MLVAFIFQALETRSLRLGGLYTSHFLAFYSALCYCVEMTTGERAIRLANVRLLPWWLSFHDQQGQLCPECLPFVLEPDSKPG